MTQAMTWAVLREFWLEYGSIVPSKVQDNIKELLEFFKPLLQFLFHFLVSLFPVQVLYFCETGRRLAPSPRHADPPGFLPIVALRGQGVSAY